MRIKAQSALFLLSFLPVAWLYGASPADDEVVPDSATQVKVDFAERCKVGGHTIILEQTTLADVIKMLRSGVIQRLGDPGDADPEWEVDYTDGQRLIRFSSDNDMGGEDHQLTGVEVRPLAAGKKAIGLPSLRLPIMFQFGSVDMSFVDLIAALGPTVNIQGVVWYEYSGKKPIKNYSGKTLDFDVLGTLRVQIASGKVVAIQLGHVTSH